VSTGISDDVRQSDERFQSPARLIAESNLPAVTADDGLRGREAETDAPGGPIARSVDPVKRAEDRARHPVGFRALDP